MHQKTFDRLVREYRRFDEASWRTASGILKQKLHQIAVAALNGYRVGSVKNFLHK